MTSHLIHIGFPKAGSSYLRRWFEAHPQLDFANGALAGFHNVYGITANAAGSPRDPLWRVTSHEGLSLPLSNLGVLPIDHENRRDANMQERQERACALLSELFPTAHVLIMTRGFRSMILSSYSQYIRTGGSETLEFLVAEGENRWRSWNYDFLIRQYERAFPGRVITLPYELLASNAAAFRAELERRLGLESFDFVDQTVNASLSSQEMRWYSWLTRSIRRLPFGRRLVRFYVRAAFHNRLRPLIAILERLRPSAAVTPDLISDSFIAQFRGHASCLASDPIYREYAREYLF